MARILIVDDSKFLARQAKNLLEEQGHEVVAMAFDGIECLTLFEQHRPDLVMLDITMPNKDGRECLQELLAMDPAARVVMLSALRAPEIIMECLQRGARDFINKPLRVGDNEFRREFADIISKALEDAVA